MLMSFLSHILSAWFAFLLPSYATFKALSHRPLNEPELQRWAMYWSVVGTFVAFQYTAEWLISWLPFYWEVKTLFLLYLALPQTQGSTHIYTTYLQPFFTQNEADLDESIAQVQKNVLTFVQARLMALWEAILNAANKHQATAPTAASSSNTSASPNGSASTFQSFFSLWQTYGTSVLNALGTKGTTSTPLSVTTSSPVQGASATATQRGSAQNYTISSNPNSNTASSSTLFENPDIVFPEPSHFQGQ